MALTPSTMAPLGEPMPSFVLFDVTRGVPVRGAEFPHDVLVVFFWCNHCPFVLHVEDGVIALADELGGPDVGFVAICSNDAQTHPQDGPEKMRERAEEKAYVFPYLHDPDQSVARAFGAACTPDFFVYDRARKLRYRGQFDASRPGKDVPVTGDDLRAAVEALRKGEAPAEAQTPSLGCNIKWRD